MNDDCKIAAAAFIILCDTLNKKKRKRRVKRRYWMTRIFQSRNKYSGSDLLRDLAIEDTGQFKNFCRLSSSDFELILNLIGPKIQKQNTNYRLAIPIKERLAVTLRYLASGDSFTSLMYTFKISKQSISKIIIEVCEALTEGLKDYIKVRKYVIFYS
jgi:hypothetical protein